MDINNAELIQSLKKGNRVQNKIPDFAWTLIILLMAIIIALGISSTKADSVKTHELKCDLITIEVPEYKVKVWHCDGVGYVLPINLQEFQLYKTGRYSVTATYDNKLFLSAVKEKV